MNVPNLREDIINVSHPVSHTPVMINEVLRYVSPTSYENYLDTTFGAGGYTQGLLNSCNCHVTALDQDPSTSVYAEVIKSEYKDRFNFINIDFAKSIELFKDRKFNAIVMDLGVSSMQLDLADRGFSFSKDGPLDMRMRSDGISAADFINNASETEIADIIFKYGDEHAARKIAHKIVIKRMEKPITTTLQLANIIRSSKPMRGKIDSATKSFQAIRIHINGELDQLNSFLQGVKDILKPAGRLVIVSFHSLEDRIVKHFIREYSPKKVAKSKYPNTHEEEIIDPNKWIKVLTPKPIVPSNLEVKNNVRARSAKLRAIEMDARIK